MFVDALFYLWIYYKCAASSVCMIPISSLNCFRSLTQNIFQINACKITLYKNASLNLKVSFSKWSQFAVSLWGRAKYDCDREYCSIDLRQFIFCCPR